MSETPRQGVEPPPTEAAAAASAAASSPTDSSAADADLSAVDFGNWIRRRIVLGFAGAGGLLLAVALLARRGWLVYPSALAAAAAFGMALYLASLAFRFSDRGGGLQRRLWRLVIESLPWDGRGCALDVGTGNGALAILLAREHPSCQAEGVDLWQADWEYSRAACERNAAALGVGDRVRFQRASATDLPYGDGELDAVVSHFVFHEVGVGSAARDALFEALRVLGPGGAFAFQDMFLDEGRYGEIEALLGELRARGVRDVRFEPLSSRIDVPWGMRSPRVLGAAGLLYGTR